MGLFAHLCHMSPDVVERTTVGHFWHLVRWIDQQQAEWSKET